MKSVIVKASELGINCWLPLRFFNSCFQCSRYRDCEYPERVVNEEYEGLLRAEEKASEAVKRFNVYKERKA